MGSTSEQSNRLTAVMAVSTVTLALLLGAMTGCKSLTPAESTRAALQDNRDLIKQHVHDPERAAKLIALAHELEGVLLAYGDKHADYGAAVVSKNADYDASREDIEALYEIWNDELRALLEKMVDTHLAMRDLATPGEWQHILDTRSEMKELMTMEEWNHVLES